MIIIGSVLLLRVRAAAATRSAGGVELSHMALPSDAVVSSLHVLRSAVAPFVYGLRRSSFIGASGALDCSDEVEEGGRAGEARERKRNVPLEEV